MDYGFLLIAYLLPLSIAGVATAMACRKRIKQGRKPVILQAILPSVFVPLIFLICLCGRYIFQASFWMGDEKFGGFVIFSSWWGLYTAVLLVPNYIILLIYQVKAKKLGISK